MESMYQTENWRYAKMVSNKTIINTFLSVPMGLLLLIVAAGALAAERNTSYKETCKSEVRQHYGTNTEVMVVSERRTNSGFLPTL